MTDYTVGEDEYSQFLDAQANRRCKRGEHGRDDLSPLVNKRNEVIAFEVRCEDCGTVLRYIGSGDSDG